MSTHIYVGIRTLPGSPNSKVVQFKAPIDLPVRSTGELIDFLDDRGLLYGGKMSGKLGSVIVPVPVAPGLNDTNPLLAAFVNSKAELQDIFDVLGDR